MPTSRDVQRLLTQAAHAPTIQDAQNLVAQAENLRTDLLREAAAGREVDLAQAMVRDHLTPVAVHEMHSRDTDWLGDVATTGDLRTAQNRTIAEATLWYGKVATLAKEYPEEFAEQARGMARMVAGAHGDHADQIEDTFLAHVGTLYKREIDAGVLKLAAGPGSGVDQATEGEFPGATFPSGPTYEGLPVDATTSERAPVIQQLEQNAHGQANQDVTPVNDPGLGQTDTQVERINNSTQETPTATVADAGQDKAASRMAMRTHPGTGHTMNGMEVPLGVTVTFNTKESSMHTQCPTCGGGGRVAVRALPSPTIADILHNPKLAFSGLDQVDQVVDPSDTEVKPTPYPTDVAFPITWTPGAQQQAIEQAEQQIAEREQRKGASRHTAASYAQAVGQHVYETVIRTGQRQGYTVAALHPQADAAGTHAWHLTMDKLRRQAGYDDSGWAGDMGAQSYGPGQQDIPPAGGATNLGYPDPVYGTGGDNGNQPIRPYGEDEADDETNKPSQWAPGQPAQMDVGGRANQTSVPPGGGGPAFPNPPITNPHQSALTEDPEIRKAQDFIRRRAELLMRQAS